MENVMWAGLEWVSGSALKTILYGFRYRFFSEWKLKAQLEEGEKWRELVDSGKKKFVADWVLAKEKVSKRKYELHPNLKAKKLMMKKAAIRSSPRFLPNDVKSKYIDGKVVL